MDFLFAGMISRLDSVSDFLSIFTIFDVFWTSIWGVFWEKSVKKWSMEKESKKESEKGTQGTRFAAEAGASGGGGGFASLLCKCWPSAYIQHALLPLTRCGGKAAASAADLSTTDDSMTRCFGPSCQPG